MDHRNGSQWVHRQLLSVGLPNEKVSSRLTREEALNLGAPSVAWPVCLYVHFHHPPVDPGEQSLRLLRIQLLPQALHPLVDTCHDPDLKRPRGLPELPAGSLGPADHGVSLVALAE